MGNAKQEAIEEIRGLIRKGQKTSAIIALGKWPIDLIKSVKSEELETEKALARQKEKDDQKTYLAGKREKHHQAFLKRMGITPKQPGDLENVKPVDATPVPAPAPAVIPQESTEENTTVVAPAAEAASTTEGQGQASEG